MNDNKNNTKRIVALVGVILLGIMIIATLLTAFLDSSGVYFRSCLIVTIALPIALWVFIWSYGAMMSKHTVASVDMFGGETPDEDLDIEDVTDSDSSEENFDE